MINEGNVEFLSNNAGGILGGISTGQDIIVRFAVKPTSSILKPVKTIDINEKGLKFQLEAGMIHVLG